MKILVSFFRFTVVTAGTFLLAGGLNLAQAQGPGSDGPTPNPAPTAVPIDGGASLLLAAGVGFGLKKLRDRRKR
ncbi:PID-CTERM protein-sorting domain-containing protein [Hymenobacter puniceus]|uniref:PID-CTERM protein-sorting domain-containing protein n=1 Tax=Hymenobacter sp. BT190 TaxID=2763505 RepID=UPI00165103FF|nr:hypothetical protein [Hymenobacter sp. BT190]MBC6698467.1 hypothetical protein [Hymenobacter sp. BT190]